MVNIVGKLSVVRGQSQGYNLSVASLRGLRDAWIARCVDVAARGIEWAHVRVGIKRLATRSARSNSFVSGFELRLITAHCRAANQSAVFSAYAASRGAHAKLPWS